jgi:hypothetical protein
MTIDIIHTAVGAIPGISGIVFTVASLRRYRASKVRIRGVQFIAFGIFTICELLTTAAVVSAPPRTVDGALAQWAFLLNMFSSIAIFCAAVAFMIETNQSLLPKRSLG